MMDELYNNNADFREFVERVRKGINYKDKPLEIILKEQAIRNVGDYYKTKDIGKCFE